MAKKKYGKAVRQKARRLYVVQGFSQSEVAKEMGISTGTIGTWAKEDGWLEERTSLGDSKAQINRQIEKLSKGTITEGRARKIAMLSKALARLNRAEKAEARNAQEKPRVVAKVVGDIVSRLRDYELEKFRPYQLKVTEDENRFRSVLKARQVGFSWLMAYEMLKGALTREVDQNLVSTSLYQAENTLRYAREHMAALGVREKGGKAAGRQEIKLPNGKLIRCLPANQATSQGWPGDVVFDEMAWYRRSRDVWEAIAPSVTAVRGRITAISTPFEAGPHNHFWKIMANDGGEYPLFSRHTVDIETATAQGLDIDMAELRGLFDSDTWARLYLCKYFTDEDSFFSLAEINECRGDCLGRWVGDDRRAGWDIAKRRHSSDMVGVEVLESQIFTRGIESWKRVNYQVQKARVVTALRKWGVKIFNVDESGVGIAVRDFVSPAIPTEIVQNWYQFTPAFKAEIAQNIKRLTEEARLIIPEDDQVLVSQFLNVKRVATGRGVSYDIAANSETHGDRFWALALACRGVEFGSGMIGEAEAW